MQKHLHALILVSLSFLVTQNVFGSKIPIKIDLVPYNELSKIRVKTIDASSGLIHDLAKMVETYLYNPYEILSMLDKERVSEEFSALGDMFEGVGLIWSGTAPKEMDWQEATELCAHLGEGVRLPTAHEYKALIGALSPDGVYRGNLIPDTLSNSFWSSSTVPVRDFARGALYFDGSEGKIYYRHRKDLNKVRCVVTAFPVASSGSM
jgi:hypothetical protein